MSKFVEELWESIFTPGPTPTLLIATNVTFAVLQVVLFALLIATYSIHFIILSVLSAGLWWAINWFAHELQVARALQDEEEEKQKHKQRRRAAVAAATASPVSTDSETEVEESDVGATREKATGQSSGGSRGQVRHRTTARQAAAEGSAGAAPTLATAAGTAATTTGDAPGSQDSNNSSTGSGSQRLSSSRSGVSTEDEWEKVSENEQ
ncbi:small nuclear ribonucleoprotein [Sporothrix brasiliensis 5110]|uniref:Small nuclear ribonucleoprotein n=1 Tax=Sporothrix brasiliensis 5110 TaxID=1398154 RepID=A0A0C2ET74_9PEZI|nr:small nuclear ribonucleoprotein [Sporothrix brasiliensis 5110]KIH89619.1 small nuclear ribonucleoprotein [Sporothrix brasiliensis 5110]